MREIKISEAVRGGNEWGPFVIHIIGSYSYLIHACLHAGMELGKVGHEPSGKHLLLGHAHLMTLDSLLTRAACASDLVGVGVGVTNFGSAKAGVGVGAIDPNSSKNRSRLQFSTPTSAPTPESESREALIQSRAAVTPIWSELESESEWLISAPQNPESESTPVFDSDSGVTDSTTTYFTFTFPVLTRHLIEKDQ